VTLGSKISSFPRPLVPAKAGRESSVVRRTPLGPRFRGDDAQVILWNLSPNSVILGKLTNYANRAVEVIPGAPLGPDEARLRGIRFYLATQSPYLHVDRTVIDLRDVQASQFEELVARQDSLGRGQECT
jgi:hypothetical protein